MALSSTDMKSRMDREFKLLGLSSTDSNQKTDILVDAVSEYVSYMDKPVISATLAVTADTYRYSIPATIRKIQDIRDADGDSVVYSEDLTTEEIVLQDNPTTGNYTVYGSPEDVRTNIDTVVAAIKTQHERVLWAYIRWAAHALAVSDRADSLYSMAREMARTERRSENRRLDTPDVTVQSLDTTGDNIEDTNNQEGRNVDIGDLFESDL